MKETNLNSTLLASQARPKKHVPLAVMAVILIHILLFFVLLIAAGCRAKARVREKALQQQELAAKNAAATNITANVTPAVVAPRQDEAPVVTTTSEAAEGVTVYVVRPGDNLGAIAKKHGTSVDAIKVENKLKSDFIRAGQELRVRVEDRMAQR